MGFFENPGKALGDAVGGAIGEIVIKAAESTTAPIAAVANAAAKIAAGAEDDGTSARIAARTSAYNKAIEEAKAAPKNYDELGVLWIKLTNSRVLEKLRIKYADLGLTDEQYERMSKIEVEAYRHSLTEENYRAQLDELHQASIEAAVAQLEYERDNPDKMGGSAPPSQIKKEREWHFEDELAHWIVDRVSSNIEGAGRERGDAAKALRGTLGISVEDIKSNGILGGDNSYLRKIIPTWSDNGGLLGGENSFFRKNLGLPW